MILITSKMDSTRVDGNSNNNNGMEEKFDNCTDDKVCVYETVISGGLYDTDNRQRNIYDYATIKDENVSDRTVVDFINEKPYDTEYKQENIDEYVRIKDEHIDDLIAVVSGTELIPYSTDDKVCLNETVISGGYSKQEPCDMKDEQGSIQDYGSIKIKNKNDLAVVPQEPELIIDCIDNMVCINETIISGGYTKEEPCDLAVVAQETQLIIDCIDNKVCINGTLISGGYIKEEPCDRENESGRIYNNVDMTACEKCGEEYDLHCPKCHMLIRIFDSNNQNLSDNDVMKTLPKNFVYTHETQSSVGIVALRVIPKGVVFGPYKGLDSTEDGALAKWKLRNKELVCVKDPRWLNWMQYIRAVDQSSHRNLVPFQYEGGLYYRSECHINVGDELLVCWDSDSKENTYWEPRVCKSLNHSYACTFCCVGYKSISHLKAHNSKCIEKRNKEDFGKEIVRCDVCKIYLDQKEYLDYHMDRCCKSNRKSVFNSPYRRNHGRSFRYRIQNGDRPFSCAFCPYKAATKSILKQHIAIHNKERPAACTICPYKTTKNSYLKRHIVIHNSVKPFACTVCTYRAITKSKLQRHMTTHNERRFVCTVCPYKTTTRANLKKHLVTHDGDRPFTCMLCEYKSMTNSKLRRHMAIHNGDKPFACTVCRFKTKNASTLKQHVLIHSDDKTYACTRCPYKTTKKMNLKRHLTFHSRDRPFACTLCPYKAARNWDLKQHIASHNEDRPFACTLCSYKATTKSILKQHIVIHNKEKPLACTLCPYKAATNTKLKRHMAIHNGDKPFACVVCPYEAKYNSTLKRHNLTHNDDRVFACTICPYKATRKATLKGHMVVHSGDKPFACTVCPYTAKRKRDLKQHIVVHKEDKPFSCTLCSYKAKTNAAIKRHVVTHNDESFEEHPI